MLGEHPRGGRDEGVLALAVGLPNGLGVFVSGGAISDDSDLDEIACRHVSKQRPYPSIAKRDVLALVVMHRSAGEVEQHPVAFELINRRELVWLRPPGNHMPDFDGFLLGKAGFFAHLAMKQRLPRGKKPAEGPHGRDFRPASARTLVLSSALLLPAFVVREQARGRQAMVGGLGAQGVHVDPVLSEDSAADAFELDDRLREVGLRLQLEAAIVRDGDLALQDQERGRQSGAELPILARLDLLGGLARGLGRVEAREGGP